MDQFHGSIYANEIFGRHAATCDCAVSIKNMSSKSFGNFTRTNVVNVNQNSDFRIYGTSLILLYLIRNDRARVDYPEQILVEPSHYEAAINIQRGNIS